MVLGIIVGLILQGNAEFTIKYIKPFGTIFLNLVKFIVGPIVLFSIMAGILSLKDISSFVLPLGATINMDGTAIYQGVCAIFIASCYGIDLSFSQMITIVLTATLASIGTAGVPGAGMVMLAMVLKSVGLPVDGIALVAGVDRIFDMGRTTLNITGDASCAIVVSSLIEKKKKKVVK